MFLVLYKSLKDKQCYPPSYGRDLLWVGLVMGGSFLFVISIMAGSCYEWVLLWWGLIMSGSFLCVISITPYQSWHIQSMCMCKDCSWSYTNHSRICSVIPLLMAGSSYCRVLLWVGPLTLAKWFSKSKTGFVSPTIKPYQAGHITNFEHVSILIRFYTNQTKPHFEKHSL